MRKKKVNYKEQAEGLTKALQGTLTLSIAYLPAGIPLAIATSAGQDVASLAATKAALQNVLSQIDNMLLQAAVREGREKEVQTPVREAGEKGDPPSGS